jgi:hypothetical protein
MGFQHGPAFARSRAWPDHPTGILIVILALLEPADQVGVFFFFFFFFFFSGHPDVVRPRHPPNDPMKLAFIHR